MYLNSERWEGGGGGLGPEEKGNLSEKIQIDTNSNLE